MPVLATDENLPLVSRVLAHNLGLRPTQTKWISRAWKHGDFDDFIMLLNWRTPLTIQKAIIKKNMAYQESQDWMRIYVGFETETSQADRDRTAALIDFILRWDWTDGLFITLTSRVNRSANQWRKLVDWIIKRHFPGVRYIAVLEPHKDGRLHCHILTSAPANRRIIIPAINLEQSARTDNWHTPGQMNFIKKQRYIQRKMVKEKQEISLTNTCFFFNAAIAASNATLMSRAEPIKSRLGVSGYVVKYIVKEWGECDWWFEGFEAVKPPQKKRSKRPERNQLNQPRLPVSQR